MEIMSEPLGILWKNKGYVVLGVGLVILFAWGHFSGEAQKEKSRSRDQDQRVEARLQKAEESFKAAIKEKGSVEQYLRENPGPALALNLAILLLLALILYGFWIDAWCIQKWWKDRRLLETLPFSEVPRWTIGDVFRVMILFLAFSVLLGVVGDLAAKFIPYFRSPNVRMVFHGTLADLTALGLVLYFSCWKYGQSFFKLQIRQENVWEDIKVGIGAYLAVLPVVLTLLGLLVWIVSIFHYEPPPQKVVGIFMEEGKGNPFLVFYTALLAMVIGPVLEEIFFRGFFYTAFRKKYSAIPSALVTGVFFSLLHESLFAFLPIFLLSLLLTYVYEKRKSLAASIACHVAHNTLFLGYFFLMKQNFLDKFLH